MTGNSGGWKQARFDLSAYAGQQVEVSISYVTDPAVGGVGAFVDDTQVLADGTVREHEGFESWSGFHGSGPGVGRRNMDRISCGAAGHRIQPRARHRAPRGSPGNCESSSR